MESATPFGTNRTGIRTSPLETEALLIGAESTVPTPGDEGDIAAVRLAYAGEAEPLGSVPPPDADEDESLEPGLSSAHKEILVDKLAQRLAFERTGVRLYDALLVKHAAYSDELPNVPVQKLQQIRAEEAEHFLMLSECLESIGADPTAQTPGADLVGIEGAGLVQAVCEPRTTFEQALDAILIAELADNDGWQSLIAAADALEATALSQRFGIALEQEEEHLRQVRQWLSELHTAELQTNGSAK